MMRESFADATFYFYGAGGELLYETTRSLPDFTEISSNYSYYVNGKLVGENGSGGRDELGFVGRSYDHDIGLYQLGARWYDPGLGRFVSPDPIPSDLNQYAYAGNNPFRYQDASGLQYGAPGYAEWAANSSLSEYDPAYNQGPQFAADAAIYSLPGIGQNMQASDLLYEL